MHREKCIGFRDDKKRRDADPVGTTGGEATPLVELASKGAG
jgi:hypothetical protein